MNLMQKILEVNKRVTTVDKGGKNTFSKYDYCRLGDILTPLRPHLHELGLVVTQSITNSKHELMFVDNGYYTISEVTCKTMVYDPESESSIEVFSTGYSTDKNGDKSAYKATTGARKYGISCAFCLEWDSVEPEDDKYDDKRFAPVGDKPKTTTKSRRF